MFEGFDTGSPWGDEDDQPEPPPNSWYMNLFVFITVAAIGWAIYKAFHKDIPKLFDMYRKDGYNGICQYVADERGILNQYWRARQMI
jgi:hypothetical protein